MEISTLSIAPRFEIKDDRFDVASLASYELYIQLSGDRLRFAVLDTTTQLFLWLEDYHIYTPFKESQFVESLKTIYKEHPFLAANFWKSISLSINSPFFTLVPNSYFNSDDSHKILNFAAGKVIAENAQIFEYKHSRFDFANLFAFEKVWHSWIKEMYPTRKITPSHIVSTLIEGISREKEFDGLHLYFEGNEMFVLCFRDKKLLFCNRFQYKNIQDLLYYVLFVVNELNLPEEIKVTFYGEITSFAENFLEISKYLPNLHFANSPNTLKFSQYFDEVPEHRYYSLFSMVHI